MNETQRKNFEILVTSLKKYGITNPNLQAGIAATVMKESDMIPKRENLNYSIDNIKRVFPYIDSIMAQKLAKNPIALGDYVYGKVKGKQLGNEENEGYKYRGAGYNQITGKANFKWIGDKIGVDLVSNPDRLNEPEIAADAAAVFFKKELDNGFKAGSFKKFGIDSLESITDTTKATQVAIQINAGRGTNFQNNIVQEGYNKAVAIVDTIKNSIVTGSTEALKTVKRSPFSSILIFVGIVGLIYVAIR